MKNRKFISVIFALAMVFSMALSVGATELDTTASTYEEVWLAEVVQFEENIGAIIDNVSGTENYYTNLAKSEEIEDREIFVKQVMSVYNALSTDEKESTRIYLQGYVDGVGSSEVQKFLENTAIKKVSRATYTQSAAVAYAEKYSKVNGNYNTAYPNLSGMGGDCANFVSQALLAGGYPMEGDWYIYKLNTLYPAPTSATQLDKSWNVASPSPWISAKEFNNYWTSKASATKTYDVSTYLNLTNKKMSSYAEGDVVQILKKSIVNYYGYHTMMITGTNTTGYLYSAHSSWRTDYPLNDGLSRYKTSDYKVKFFKVR